MPKIKPPELVLDPETTGNPVHDFFLAYWRNKCAGRSMPSRADMVMRDFKEHLGWVCLIDAPPGFKDFRYRLVGSKVSDYFLSDGTGRLVAESFPDSEAWLRDGQMLLLRTTCESKRPLRIHGPMGNLGGRYFPDYDFIYMPLSDDGQNANMVFNVFTFNYDEIRRRRPGFSLSRPG